MYDEGGTVIVWEKGLCSSLKRARNSSMEPLSGWRTTKSPLAGELVMKCPVMTISLPVDVAVTLWMSKVPKTKQNN